MLSVKEQSDKINWVKKGDWNQDVNLGTELSRRVIYMSTEKNSNLKNIEIFGYGRPVNNYQIVIRVYSIELYNRFMGKFENSLRTTGNLGINVCDEYALKYLGALDFTMCFSNDTTQFAMVLEELDSISKIPKAIKEEIKTILLFPNVKEDEDMFNNLLSIHSSQGAAVFIAEMKQHSREYPEVIESLFAHFNEQEDIDLCAAIFELLNKDVASYTAAAYQIGHFYMLSSKHDETSEAKRHRQELAITYLGKAGDFQDARVCTNRLLAELSGNIMLNFDYANKSRCIFQMAQELEQLQNKIKKLELRDVDADSECKARVKSGSIASFKI